MFQKQIRLLRSWLNVSEILITLTVFNFEIKAEGFSEVRK
jgi:hypothetical protein